MDLQEEDPQGSSETQPLLEAVSSPSPEIVQKSPTELRREWDAKLKDLRLGIRDLEKAFDKTEEDMKALQSVGQIVGEVLKQLDEEKFIVKASSGPRYVVGCRNKVNKEKLKQGARVGIQLLF